MDVITEKDKFLTASRSSQSLERWSVTARPLEAAVSVWVEYLPPNADEGAVKYETLSLYLILVLWFYWEHVF